MDGCGVKEWGGATKKVLICGAIWLGRLNGAAPQHRPEAGATKENATYEGATKAVAQKDYVDCVPPRRGEKKQVSCSVMRASIGVSCGSVGRVPAGRSWWWKATARRMGDGAEGGEEGEEKKRS